MAKNDLLLLDGIIDDRVNSKVPSADRGEAFEYLVLEQLLKNFDLSSDEIQYGWIDGRGDGGIDGFYVLVNGSLLQDPEGFAWPKSSTEIRIVVVTCKHHDTFKQATLDALIATTSELFDLSIDESRLVGAYSSSLLQLRANLIVAYRRLASNLAGLVIELYYASRGSAAALGDEVLARGRQVESIAA